MMLPSFDQHFCVFLTDDSILMGTPIAALTALMLYASTDGPRLLFLLVTNHGVPIGRWWCLAVGRNAFEIKIINHRQIRKFLPQRGEGVKCHDPPAMRARRAYGELPE